MNLRLELFVESIERAADFYRDILEFEVPSEIKYSYLPISKGNVTLGLGEMKNMPDDHPLRVFHGQKAGLGIEIVLEVADVKEFYYRVVAKEYPIATHLGQRSWGLEDFRIMDPDGYYLRITSE